MQLKLFLEQTGQSWTLKPSRSYVIGSGASCDVSMSEMAGLAEQQFRLIHDASIDHWLIENLAPGGTVVNGMPISQNTVLKGQVRVAANHLMFVVTPDVPQVPGVFSAETAHNVQAQAISMLQNPVAFNVPIGGSTKSYQFPVWQGALIGVSASLVFYWAIAGATNLFSPGAMSMNPIEQLFKGRSQKKNLFSFRQNNRVGFIDKSGRVLINPQFDGAFDFYEGRASVKIGDKWGVINQSGTMVVNPQYDFVTRFREGLAAIRMKDQNGYIDTSGKIVINPQFKNARPFADGLAAVQVGDKWGFVDQSGKLVINPQFDFADDFAEGLTDVKIGDSWGFVDKAGKLVINPQFKQAEKFVDGMAKVQVGDKYGFINKSGQLIINPQFDVASLQAFEGLITIRIGDKWGFADTTGKIVINPQFEDAGRFSDGLAAVRTGGKWGFINTTGKIVINPQFDGVDSGISEDSGFNNGLIEVSIGDKQGYIDRSSHYVLNPTN